MIFPTCLLLIQSVIGIALAVKGIDLIRKDRSSGGIALFLLGAALVASDPM